MLNKETRQLIQILLIVGLFGLQSALNNSNRLETVAIQLWVSIVGALIGQVLAKSGLRYINNMQNSHFTFWKSDEYMNIQKHKPSENEKADLRPTIL